MALHVRPAYLQGLPADNPAAGPGRSASEDRNTLHALVGRSEGTLLAGDLAVTPGTGLRVNVAPGDVFITIPASKALRGGSYHTWNDAVYSHLLDPAPTSGARLDWFGIRVVDRQFNEFATDGSTDKAEWFYRAGTPSAGTGQQLPSVTDVPGTLYRLAAIPVGQNATAPGTIIPRLQPLTLPEPPSWYGDDADTAALTFAPGATRVLIHPTRLRTHVPMRLAGTVGIGINCNPEYQAVGFALRLDDVIGSFSAIPQWNVPISHVSVAGDPDFSNIGRSHAYPVVTPGVIQPGLHSLRMLVSPSSGTSANADFRIPRWTYHLRPHNAGADI